MTIECRKPQKLTFKENYPKAERDSTKKGTREEENPLSCEVLLDGVIVDRIWFEPNNANWHYGGNRFTAFSDIKNYIRDIYKQNDAAYEVKARGTKGEETMGYHLSLDKARQQVSHLRGGLWDRENYPAHKGTATSWNTQIFIWDHGKNEEVEFNGDYNTVEWIAEELNVSKSTIYRWLREGKADARDEKAEIGYYEVTEVYFHSLPAKYKEILKEKQRKRGERHY